MEYERFCDHFNILSLEEVSDFLLTLRRNVTADVMKKIMSAVVVAAMMMLGMETSGMAGVALAARVTVEYGIEASLRVVPQKGMKQGVPGKITVMFSQDVSDVKNFKEATDYQKLQYLDNHPSWYEHRTLTY